MHLLIFVRTMNSTFVRTKVLGRDPATKEQVDMSESQQINSNHTPANQPFAGLTVVEISTSVAAPFAGQIFSELGARLVKVEKSTGDDARGWGPPFWEGASAYF